MSTDEEKYKKLRDQLHSLPRMKAKNDFESRLFARIKELENAKPVHAIHKHDKENVFVYWLSNLLRPSLVPAMGLTVVLLAAIVVYFSYYSKLTTQQDTKVSSENTNTQKGEFVIYVKKDGERIIDETNRDITSADINTSTSSSDYRPPSYITNDGMMTQPKIDADIDREVHDKLDRISTEQEFKMEKESKSEPDADKIKSKSDDDGIMKKGYYKEGKKDAPSNYDRTKSEDTGEQYQGGKNEGNINPQEEIKQQNDEESQKDSNKLSERKKETKKDSLKVKDKKIEDKDTIEK